MSTKGRKDIYGYYGVYGSLAYDFRPIGNERAGEYSGNAAGKQKKKTKCRAGGSPALLISSVLCIVLLITGLLGRSQTVVLSDEVSTLKKEIAELNAQQTKLKIEHASAFLPGETEAYAIEKLGMKKPGADQIIYIELVDRSEQIVENTAPKDFWSVIREYLPG